MYTMYLAIHLRSQLSKFIENIYSYMLNLLNVENVVLALRVLWNLATCSGHESLFIAVSVLELLTWLCVYTAKINHRSLSSVEKWLCMCVSTLWKFVAALTWLCVNFVALASYSVLARMDKNLRMRDTHTVDWDCLFMASYQDFFLALTT